MADEEIAAARRKAEEERKRKQALIDAKKAEVRARLEQQAAQKKGKKGFMTPERKKKLRLLLRRKAAEELKKEQERKAAERRRIIEERCGKAKDLDAASEDELKEICKTYKQRVDDLEGLKWDLEYETLRKEAQDVIAVCQQYHGRLYACESQKWDLEYEVRKREFEINELNIQVNDLRGKFVKPTLKKVSKYENKFAKLQKKAAEFNFRNQLKQVKKKEFTMDEEGGEGKKPDWSKGKKEAEEAPAE